MRIALLFLSFICCSSAAQRSVLSPPPPEIVADFNLDAAYAKCILVEGLPIVASAKVDDHALLEAAWLIAKMLGGHPEILKAMAKNKVRFGIMAHNEFTTDIPEHRTLIPKRYWDRRARGLGASSSRPAVTCGEENLLCLPGDPYGTENILIHEFGHALHQMGLSDTDPTFDKRLAQTYQTAMKAGLWKGKYASVNRMEYWAEGTQSWFDTNRENDHDHNHVNTRSELKEYDPALAALCAEIYGEGAWRYVRPEKREQPEHFQGYDFAKAPKYSWPEELNTWTETALSNPLLQPTGLAEVPFMQLTKQAKAPASTNESKGDCSLIIANATERELSVSWVDFDGHLQPHGSVRGKFVSIQETHPGHVFIVTEEDGTPVGYGIAKSGDSRVVIKERK